MPFLTDKGFLALKPQVDADTPILPSNHFPLVGEDIKVDGQIEADRRMFGVDFKAINVEEGAKKIDGSITLFGSPEELGHIFNMAMAKGTTTGDATDGYTHPFTPGDGKHYTLEIAKGDYAKRYFGVRADSIQLSYDAKNRQMVKATIKAKGCFFGGTLAVALTGAGMTSAVLKRGFGNNPTKGLVVGDTIVVGGVEVELLTVDADGITVTFASTSITASVDDPVYLKAQTPSFGTIRDPFSSNNTLVGMGDDETAATSNAGAKSTASPILAQDSSFEFKNNLLEANEFGEEGPGRLLNQVKEASFTLKSIFESPDEWRRYMERVARAVTLIAKGKFIKSDFSTEEKLTIKFYGAKSINNDQPSNIGGYLIDEQTIECLYDTSASKSYEVTLVNRTAGTSY